MRGLKWLVAIVVIILIIWGFSRGPVDEPGSTEPIKIGGALSLTGFAAESGDMAMKAMELARDEINAAGGIDGRMIELVIEDDETDPTGSVNAFRKLIDIDKVDAALAGFWDFTNQPIIPIAREAGVTYITPTDFRIEGSTVFDKHSFSMFSDFKDVIDDLTEFLAAKDPEQLAVVRFTSSFGEEITKTLDSIMVELGKPAVIDETYADLGTNDYRTTILKLKEAGVDAVFLDMISPDSFTFMRQVKEQGYEPLIISHVLIADVLANDDLDNSVVSGAYILDWTFSSQSFTDKFTNKYGMAPRSNAEQSYEAVHILAEAVANTSDRSEVNDYLETHTFTEFSRPIEFTDLHIVKDTPTRIMIIEGDNAVPATF